MTTKHPYSASDVDFSADLLRGADQIATFLFGDAGQRRRVYHLAETSRLPVFRLGSTLCARRSVLLAWVTHQEGGGGPPRPHGGAAAVAVPPPSEVPQYRGR
jgi:hypothetical protein